MASQTHRRMLHDVLTTQPITRIPEAAPPARRSVSALLLLVLVLVVGASLAGLLSDGLYRDPAALRALFRGYDLIALFVAVPVFALSLALFRSSLRARVVAASVVAFCIYNYAFYVFGAAYNAAFLAHTAILSASLVAFVLMLVELDVTALAASFGPRTPTRLVGGSLVLLGLGLGFMWVIAAVRFAVTDVVPAEPSSLILPTAITHLGSGLDLVLLIPSYIAAGVLLWRRSPWGFIVAPIVLVAGVFHQLSYMTALVFQARANVVGATGFDSNEPFIAAIFLAGSAALLFNMERAKPE